MYLALSCGAERRTFKTRKCIPGIGFGIAIFLLCARPDLKASETNEKTLDPPLTVSQVVSRMVEMNERRSESLCSYTSVRSYHVELHGLLNKHADMEVKMTYQWPGKKGFVILSQSGSVFMRNHVLKRLIEAEDDASRQTERRQVSITPHNYIFKLGGHEHNAQGDFYILDAIPRAKRKFLFKGRIWVSARQFAMMRIEGQPAKTLSWWTPKVNFTYDYKKVGGFWFPALNKTITRVRIFGHSVLTIRYMDYDLTKVRKVKVYTWARPVLSDRIRDRTLIPPVPAQ